MRFPCVETSKQGSISLSISSSVEHLYKGPWSPSSTWQYIKTGSPFSGVTLRTAVYPICNLYLLVASIMCSYLGSTTGRPKSFTPTQETVPFFRVLGKVGVLMSMSLVPSIASSSHSEIALSTLVRQNQKILHLNASSQSVQVMPRNPLWHECND